MKKSLALSLVLLTCLGNLSADAPKEHPCVAFGHGDPSWSSAAILNLAAAFTDDEANLVEKLLRAGLPFMHAIKNHETAGLTEDGGPLAVLANNWTSLGIATAVYALKQRYKWETKKAITYLLGAIYTQWGLAIAASKVTNEEALTL